MLLKIIFIFLLLNTGAFADDGDFHGAIQATDITASGKFYGDGSLLTSLPVPSLSPSSASHSITSSCNANGWQVSASKSAMVSYTVQVSTTATIGGNSSGSIILKTSPTNSSVAGEWIEAGRMSNAQAISLAVVLQSVQTVSAPVFAMIPPGYYVCLQSSTVAGLPTYSYLSGQEIIIG